MGDSQKLTGGSRKQIFPLTVSKFEDFASPYNFITGFFSSEATHISALPTPTFLPSLISSTEPFLSSKRDLY